MCRFSMATDNVDNNDNNIIAMGNIDLIREYMQMLCGCKHSTNILEYFADAHQHAHYGNIN